MSLFFTGLLGFALFDLFNGSVASIINSLFGILGLAGAVIGGYYMYKLYRIPARPFWNHWHTGALFFQYRTEHWILYCLDSLRCCSVR